MEEQKSAEPIAHVDPDLEELIPGYLDNRKKDIAAIGEALLKNDWDTIRVLGHSMKGSGGGYGFDVITDIGMLIEKAAKESRDDLIRPQVQRLQNYLDRVKIVYD